MHSDTHLSGYKIRVTGLPPREVCPLDEGRVRTWLRLGFRKVAVEDSHGVQDGAEVDHGCMDINWNFNAASRGGRGRSG